MVDVTMPDGTVIQGVPDGVTQAQLASKYAAHLGASPQQTGDQPTVMQTIAASPIGRLIHNAILQPVAGAASLLAKADPTGGAVAPMAARAEGTYQDALTAQQNRPGYAEARAQADAQTQARGAGGLTDQFISTLAPALAGTAGLFGGLNASNAAADSQQAAQDAYAKANPVTSTGAQILGGFAAIPDGGLPRLPAAVPKQIAPSIGELRAAARAAYKQVDDSGVRVSTDSLNGMADNLEDRIGPRLDPTLHPEATAAYNRVMKYKTDQPTAVDPASFGQLNTLRQVVADAGQAIKPADRALALQIRDHLDDYVNGLTSADLDTSALDQARGNLTSITGQKGAVASQIKSIEATKPGALAARGAAGAGTRDTYMTLQGQLPQLEAQRQAALGDFQNENAQITAGPQNVIDSLNSARDLWSRQAKASTLQNIIDKAKNNSTGFAQSGYENALRNGFRKLLNNDRGIARFSPDERAAIQQVATGGSAVSATNLLRQVGKLSPQGAIPLLSELAMVGAAGPTALAIPAAGLAGRAGATMLQRAAAQRAVDLAAMGRGATAIPSQAMLQLPQLTSRSALPLGMFGAPALQPQNQ